MISWKQLTVKTDSGETGSLWLWFHFFLTDIIIFVWTVWCELLLPIWNIGRIMGLVLEWYSFFALIMIIQMDILFILILLSYYTALNKTVIWWCVRWHQDSKLQVCWCKTNNLLARVITVWCFRSSGQTAFWPYHDILYPKR